MIYNKSGIYKILNWSTNKFYIGSAVKIQHRLNNHKSDLNLCKHPNIILQRAWLKYGEADFSFHVLEYCNKENLLEREQFYIDNLKPSYNILSIAGSSIGYAHTENTKLKISIANTGRKRPQEEIDKIKNSTKGLQNRLGHKASAETKLKMSLAQQKRQGYKVIDITSQPNDNMIIWKRK